MDGKVKEESWLLIRKDGKVQPLIRGMMFVGREECDIILQSASADKRHAVVFFDPSDKEIRIKDLNSITGTYVNGIRIPEQSYVKLKHLDCLRFGYGPDVFHIQKTGGSLPASPTSHKSFGRNTRELIVEKKAVPPKESKLSIKEDKMPVEKPSKIVISKGEDEETQLHEADSLEDLKHMSSDSAVVHSEVNSIPPKNITSQTFNSLTFKRNNSDNNVMSSSYHGSVPSLEKVTHKNGSTNQNKTFSEPKTKLTGPPDLSLKSVIEPECDITIENKANTDEFEKSESPTASSPIAMAFTVAFDNPTPRKKLGIRDSISKYAPRKAEAERNTTRQKQVKPAEPVIRKSIIPEIKNECLVEYRKKKSPGERTLEDLEDGWKMVNQRENDKNRESKLSEGATYLIRKMFNGESKSPPSDKQSDAYVLPKMPQPVNNQQNSSQKKEIQPTKVPRSSPRKENDIIVSDDKSETGTYTIEEELNDAAVQEARKKIDEVFGVLLPEENGMKISPPVTKLEKAPDIHRQTDISPKPPKQVSDASDSDTTPSWNKTDPNIISGVPIRPKRRLPTPPVQASSVGSGDSANEGDKMNLINYGTYNVKNRDQYVNPMSKSDIVLREHSPTYDQKIYLSKERLSANPQTSRMMLNNRLTLNNLQLDMLQNAGDGIRTSLTSELHSDHSPQSRTPPAGVNWRRTPWNLSGSDLELDQSRMETASVLSDISASTEPTSLSFHSSRNRTETGPQMKFNRAFALRRARLGLDTDIPSSSSKVAVSKDSQSKNQKSGTHLTPPASTLSRQDGGRFSLRLPKSSSKVAGNKNGTKMPVSKSSAVVSGLKVGHRRMDSDPGKTAFLRKGDTGKVSVSDTERRQNLSKSFCRSASFCGNDEDGGEQPVVLRKPQQKSIARRETVILARHSPNEELAGNHVVENRDTEQPNRSSPQLKQSKQELSALDSLVISAIHHLSVKLRTGARTILEKERDKFVQNSNERLMIDEVLPQVVEKRASDSPGEGNLTRDLSSILKNLKRVEQSLEVLAAVVDGDQPDSRKKHGSTGPQNNFFVVNV